MAVPDLLGLIEGVTLQALQTAGSIEGGQTLRVICEPERSTADEAIGIVVRYVDAHPELRAAPIATTTYQALAAAWPCPNPAPR